MLQHILFEIKKADKTKAIEFLNSFTNESLYQIEEKGKIFVGGFFKNLPQELPNFLSKFTLLTIDIDWQNQWNEFSPINHENLFEINLSEYGVDKKIILKPGPGFGDLSHATTKLCLKHMAKFCPHHEVIDFGCGSGILSVAAYAFDASRVISLDIEQDAIVHTKENLALNHYDFENVFKFMPLKPLGSFVLCVINMTFGEQKVALKNLDIFPRNTKFLSSGILTEQIPNYLLWSKEKGLNVKLIDTLQGWAIFEGRFF